MRGGVLHGPLEQYGERGQLLVKTFFEHGKMHGPMAVFDEDGLPVQKSQFREGLAHGPMEVYVHGRCVSRQTMVKGVASGPSLSYDEAGNLLAIDDRRNGICS